MKTFWVIQDNENVINSIKKLNKRNALRSMVTFDFSTLYTKIPHEKLLEVMNKLVDFCFQGGTHEQLSLAKYGAKWVSKNNRSGLRFTRSMVKDALEYLMGNCYFTIKYFDKLLVFQWDQILHLLWLIYSCIITKVNG